MARSGRTKAERAENRASVTAMRVLAHPLRLRLLELLAEGRRTTKQAAQMLGEPPTRLYHHVHALERAGLLRLRETRRKRGTHEKYYEVPPPLLKSGMLRGPVRRRRMGRRDILGMGMAMLEAARGEVAAALSGPPAKRPGAKPLLVRLVIRSEVVAERIRGDLVAVLRKHAARAARKAGARDRRAPSAPEGPSEAGERWSLTILLVPPGGRQKGSTIPAVVKARNRR